MQLFDAGNNSLVGSIPETVCNWTQLQTFSAVTEAVGVPEWYAEAVGVPERCTGGVAERPERHARMRASHTTVF